MRRCPSYSRYRSVPVRFSRLTAFRVVQSIVLLACLGLCLPSLLRLLDFVIVTLGGFGGLLGSRLLLGLFDVLVLFEVDLIVVWLHCFDYFSFVFLFDRFFQIGRFLGLFVRHNDIAGLHKWNGMTHCVVPG